MIDHCSGADAQEASPVDGVSRWTKLDAAPGFRSPATNAADRYVLIRIFAKSNCARMYLDAKKARIGSVFAFFLPRQFFHWIGMFAVNSVDGWPSRSTMYVRSVAVISKGIFRAIIGA